MSDVIVPQLGETITEATISIWLKAIGEHVEAGEPIAEVSTDKVDTEIVAPTAGRLTEIRIPAGETASVGEVIAVLSVDGDDGSDAATAPSEPATPAAQAAVPAPTPAPVTPTAPAINDGATVPLLSPEVRRLLVESSLDPAAITGTGSGGRITPADVTDAAPPGAVGDTTPATAPPLVADTSATRVPLSRIRLATGRHMIDSLATSPHALSSVEVDYSNVDRTRTAHREEWTTREGFSLTYLPFIARAIVDALRAYPHLNASIDGDHLVVHPSVHMGIAVDLEHQGLIVPVIGDADTKRLHALSREIHGLATNARARKLTLDDLHGGTFTITNNGSAGSVMSSAIINQPQVAIVSTDAVGPRPTVVTLPDGNDAIVIRPIGHLTMTWDHRAFDGAYAAGFLVEVKKILETRNWDDEL